MGYTLSWHPNLVHFHYEGTVSADDILQSNLRVYGDPRFDELQWQMASFDEQVQLHTDSETVKKIAYFDRAAFKSNPRIQVLLVGSERIQAQIFDTYAEHADPHGWEVISFASLDEAFDYLGFDPRRGS